MLLGELISGLDVTLRRPADARARICDVTEDSRTVLPGSLFIARAGTKADGRRFIDQAIALDASAILTDPGVPPPSDLGPVAWGVTNDVARAEAFIAERFFGEPSKRLALCGVTGTNGKTTITTLVYQMLNAARRRCGLIGTVMVDDGTGIAPATLTTPPALEMSYALSNMVERRYTAAALEVSSHSLDQGRVAALDFDVAVFTNLTGDHLDYHGTMERYAQAKAALFAMLRPDAMAIVNAQDPWTARMLQDCRARVLACAVAGADGPGPASCVAQVLRANARGTELLLRGPWGTIEGQVALIGAFNVMNVLQAFAAAFAMGLDAEHLQAALPRLRAPHGRLDRVSATGVADPDPGFSVFVDYAHTDDALAKAIGALRPLLQGTEGRLIVVFGCGGDRDKTKRPRMGRIAASMGDEVIVTSDNPRTEDPHAIIRDIVAGVENMPGSGLHVEPDRGAAIARAIEHARAGDIVLIAGKGHEDYQLVPDGAGGITRLHFDDREAARQALHKRLSAGSGENAAPTAEERMLL